MILHSTSFAITQCEHARLSALLLNLIPTFKYLKTETKEDLKRACIHHDDGWKDWDNLVKIDPKTNLPIDFQHMAYLDHIKIWMKSNKLSRKFSPKTKNLILTHSLYLAQIRYNHTSITHEQQAITNFMNITKEQLTQSVNSLNDLHTFLKQADWLSLMICMNKKNVSFEGLSLNQIEPKIFKCHSLSLNKPTKLSINGIALPSQSNNSINITLVP